MGHPEDNLEPAPHVCGGHLIDYVIHFHRGDKGIDLHERLSIADMRHVHALALAGQRQAVRTALPLVGQHMDEGGLTSLMVSLHYLWVPPADPPGTPRA